MTDLSSLMAAAYNAHVGLGPRMSHPELVAALQAAPDVLADAVAYRATLDGDQMKRCFVKRTHRTVLDAVLPLAQGS